MTPPNCAAGGRGRVVDIGMVAKYCLFVLEVVKAWVDPAVKQPRTLHHLGCEKFMVAGDTIRLNPG